MAGLATYATTSGTTGLSERSVARITAPANQKVYVFVKIHLKATSTSAAHIVGRLVRSMSGGSVGSALTINKRDSRDNETPRVSATVMSGLPTGGTELDRHAIEPRSYWTFRQVTLNQNETLDILLNSAVDYLYEINIDMME